MRLSPIALFIYNRPRHTRRTVETLQNNVFAKESELFVFSDGPKSDGDRKAVQEVRDYMRSLSGFKRVTLIEREINTGLSRSIIAGVTEVVHKYGKVIVLEDDLVSSPYFLQFMNDALELYQGEERVISIHGYVYPVRTRLPETFFLKGADCWGWGTWKRGWDLFEPDGNKLLTEIKKRNLERRFDMNGTYPYTAMLSNQTAGKNDSWAIRWHASAFLHDKFTLYPGKSLIQNIGLDASGTHSGATGVFESEITQNPIIVRSIPLEINTIALREFEDYFRTLRPSFTKRLLKKIWYRGTDR